MKNVLKKLKLNIEEKTKSPREFLRKGRPAAMIAELMLGTAFLSWIPVSMFNCPVVLSVIISALLLFLLSELLSLTFKLVIGVSSRPRAYFYISLATVLINCLISTQGNAAVSTVLLGFLLVLSVSLFSRSILGFFREKRFRQLFGYVVLTLSSIYLVFFAVLFFSQSFGKSRVDFYNEITENEKFSHSKEEAKGFEAYLSDGSYEVATLSYGPDEAEDIVTTTLDFSIYDSYVNRSPMDKFKEFTSKYDFKKTPVKGQIWYPVGQTNCPVLFFVHGNHSAKTESYLGYEYLGKYLASNGYVFVSVDENIINDLSEGNDKRAILFLENMKALLTENADKSSPIYNLIDPDRIAIGGHSRGGEMVATAYLFNGLDAYPDDGNHSFNYHFNISGLVAVAPVVDQYAPAQHPVEICDVNYLLLHGSNDQDVSSMMGEKQYNNVTFTEDSKSFHLKSSVYILGANHGQFNSLWGRYDMEGATNGLLYTRHFIDEAQQKLIAKAYIRAFLDASLSNECTYASLLSDNSSYLEYLPKTAYITNYQDSEFKSLCSFDDTVDIAHSEKGAKISCKGTSNWKLEPYKRGMQDEGEDYVLSLTWKENMEPRADIKFKRTIDISNGAISFGIADMSEDTEDIKKGLDYTVILTDASGRTITEKAPVLVYHSLAVQLYKPDVLFGSYEYKHQLQTENITPDMFTDQNFDFEHVAALGIMTNGSKDGKLIINNVGYYENAHE
jgi:hypothetical protein